MTFKISSLSVAVLAIMLALSASAAEARDRKDIKMRFEIDDGVLELNKNIFWTTRSNCKSKNHDGCYDLPNNYYGRFKLTLKKGDEECGKTESWRFHPTEAVVLGGEGNVTDPRDKPSSSGEWGGISEYAAKDYGAEAATGVVSVVSDGNKSITFEAQNESARPYSIWYKVRVASCEEDANGKPVRVLEYDPRVDNRGRPTG